VVIFAVETSCDETAVAILRDGTVLANLVSSQVALHREYGGVVPELAAREHLRNLLPLAKAAFRQAGLKPAQVDAVAATQGPGLPSALRAGFETARAFAFAGNKAFIGIHHHEAHLYSPWISGNPGRADFHLFQPSVSLIASGGHTLLVHVKAELDHHVLGTTVDDAAGECFDKIGKLLGLPYPAGPEIELLAERGDGTAFAFPRPMLGDPRDDFSFSGLKTAVRYFLAKNPEIARTPEGMASICASVQAAIIEVLVTKTVRAARTIGSRCITASGGVLCNRSLRGSFEAICRAEGLALRFAEKQFCTDNAAMIAVLAERKLMRGTPQNAFDSDVKPGWPL